MAAGKGGRGGRGGPGRSGPGRSGPGGGSLGRGRQGGAGGRRPEVARDPAVRLRTAKSRKASSARWLQRQLNDPYVAEAKRAGYRSRAAFKLIQIDEKHPVLRPGAQVVDLGAAPGGWTQVAVKKVGPKGQVVALDILEMEPVPGAANLQMDFLLPEAPEALKAQLGGSAEVVLSDMAAPTTGHRQTDHLKIMALAEAALDFAEEVLAPGGAFVAKTFEGGGSGELVKRLKQAFKTVKHVKPPASRSDSSEIYVVALGFRGAPGAQTAAGEDRPAP